MKRQSIFFPSIAPNLLLWDALFSLAAQDLETILPNLTNSKKI